MPTMGEAILAHMGGAANIGGLRGAIAYGARSRGSLAAFAREAGVSASTMRGWASGRKPRSSQSGLVDTMRAEARADALGAGNFDNISALTIVGKYGYRDKDGGHFTASNSRGAADRDRTVQLGDYLQPSTGPRLVQAYLAGAGPERLGQIFADGINDNGFYARTFDPDNADGDGWDIDAITGWG